MGAFSENCVKKMYFMPFIVDSDLFGESVRIASNIVSDDVLVRTFFSVSLDIALHLFLTSMLIMAFTLINAHLCAR